MKNIYTLALICLSSSVVFGQQQLAPKTKTAYKPKLKTERSIQNEQRGGGVSVPIWYDDFSDPSTWVIDHDPLASSLDWEIGQNLGCGGNYPIDTINSTTQANGYAMVDSDEYGGATGGTEIEDSWITTASPINLSGHEHVVLQFESQYWKWTNEECYVVISTNNTDWPDLDPFTDISSMPNVYHVWPGMEQQDDVENPTLVEINISESAGNEANVWVRFHWTGTWGYSWFVDDVAIVPQPAHDIRMESTFISQDGSYIQYGTIPSNQTGQNMLIGSDVFNFGHQDQTNLSFEADFGSFTATSSLAVLPEFATEFMTGTPSPTLAPGSYTGNFTVESDDDNPDSLYYYNNIGSKSFKVSCETCWDGLFAIDDLPVSWGTPPSQDLSYPSIGTQSYTDATDGLGLFSMYHVSDPITVSGISILLDTSLTDVGGEIIATMHDANGFTNSDPDPNNALTSSDVYTITQTDLDAQSVFIPFNEPASVSNDSVYGGVFLYSNVATSNVAVLDDESRWQPASASQIYIAGSGVYINGTALAVRLKLCSNSNSFSETACGSYTWNNNTYTQSGIYGAVSGPASCETLDLTILPVDPPTIWNYDLCPGDSVWFTAGASPTLYTWNDPGQYSEPIQNANGCTTFDEVNVTALSEPIVSILGNTIISPNSSETYAFVDPGGYTFTWSAINGTILGGQGTTSVDIFWDASGGGQVILNLDGQCPTSDTLTVGTFVGVEDHWINDLQIHPNPSSGNFNMELTEPAVITVLDARGRAVVKTNANGQFTLDLSAFPTGTYTLQLNTESGVGLKRLVKY